MIDLRTYNEHMQALTTALSELSSRVRQLEAVQIPMGGVLGPHDILSLTHPDSTPAAVVRGDMITGQGLVPTWTRLAAGGANTVLTSDGTDLTWQATAAVNHNLLSATHGDTTVQAVSRGSVVTGQGAVPTWNELVLGGITGSIITRDATDVLWSTFALAGTAGQTYTFPAVSGGVALGAGTLTAATGNDATIANHTHAITNTSDGDTTPSTLLSTDANGTLRVRRLGAGVAAIAVNGTVALPDDGYIGNASNDLRIIFDSSNGYIKNTLGDNAGSDEFQVLDSDNVEVFSVDSNGEIDTVLGAGYVASSAGGVLSVVASVPPSVHNVLDSTYHSDVLTGAITRGDLLYGNATPKIARLALGGIAGSFPTRDATDVLWSTWALAGTAAQTYTFPAITADIQGGTGTAGQVAYWGATAEILIGAATYTYQTAGSPNLFVQAANAAHIAQVVKGAAAQTANLLQFQNSGGTALGGFYSNGIVYSYGANGATNFLAGDIFAMLGGGFTNSVIIGAAALTAGCAGSGNNTVVGANALWTAHDYCSAFGSAAMQYAGGGGGAGCSYGVGVGYQACYYPQGIHNTAVGAQSLRGDVITNSSTDCTGVGFQSLYAIRSGNYNSALGASGGADLTSGASNTLLGYNTGRGITTGSGNSILGASIGGLAAALTNNIIFASGGTARATFDGTDWNFTGNVGIGTTVPKTKLNVNSGQVVIDSLAAANGLFATTKFDSQGNVWTTDTALPALIFNAATTPAQRPEISWYRGSRTYPEFSIRQAATADTGGTIYSGNGTGVPTATMTFRLGNVLVGTGATPDRLFHAEVADAVTNAVTYATRTSHTTSGTAAALFGVGREDELEDAAGNMQVASEQTTLWAAATSGSESPLLRMTTYPAGTAGPGYCGFWTWNNVDDTVRIMIPNGAGDVTAGITILYWVEEATGGSANGYMACGNSDTITLYNAGGETLLLEVTAAGQVEIARSAGVSTFDVVIWAVWI